MELPSFRDVGRFLRTAHPVGKGRASSKEESKEAAESVAVTSIEEHPVSSVLKNTAVLWVTTDEPVFDFKLLPLEHSRGLVGWNGEEMRILRSAEPSNLAWLLRSEGDLSEIPAGQLVSLCSDSLLGKGNSRHQLLSSLGELDALCSSNRLGGRFAISTKMRDEIGVRLSPPTSVSDPSGAHHLTFFTLYGWMQKLGALCSHEVVISSDFAVTASSDIVIENVFEAMPLTRY